MDATESDKAIDALYDEFRNTYGFVSISRKDVAEYWRNMHGNARVDLLLDYILANGLEEDIML
jgi:hypothetical protein